MKSIYTAVVTSQGGRSGYISSADGMIEMKVNMPKELGGPGGGVNPELLFAGGYAACFESALQFTAQKNKKPLNLSKVEAHVSIGPKEGGGFLLETKLRISLPGYGKEASEILIQEAHKVCPYSNATRNNMKVELELIEA